MLDPVERVFEHDQRVRRPFSDHFRLDHDTINGGPVATLDDHLQMNELENYQYSTSNRCDDYGLEGWKPSPRPQQQRRRQQPEQGSRTRGSNDQWHNSIHKTIRGSRWVKSDTFRQ